MPGAGATGATDAQEKQAKEQTDGKSGHASDAVGSQRTALILGLIGGVIALVIKTLQSDKLLIGARDTSLFRGMNGLKDEYDLVIVGAGLSGAVPWSSTAFA